eukprot:5506093-Lingulodinium_polyedra.AAC.1
MADNNSNNNKQQQQQTGKTDVGNTENPKSQNRKITLANSQSQSQNRYRRIAIAKSQNLRVEDH